MTLEELQGALRDKNTAAQAIVDKAEQEGREMTEEEGAEVEGLLADMDDLKEKIDAKQVNGDRIKRLKNAGRTLSESPGRATTSGRVDAAPRGPEDGGFADLGEFGACVRAAMNPAERVVDDRLSAIHAGPVNHHREGGSSDGYMVPPHFREQIWDLVFDEPDLFSMVDQEPTGSNSVQFIADETTPWGAGGVQAHWAGEGQKMEPSRLETRATQLKLHKLYAFVYASDELLEDGPRLNSRLTTTSARAIKWKLNTAVMYGTGVAQPLGYFPSKALVSVPKESGQGAATIVPQNVAKMYSRNLTPGRGIWQANSDILPALMGMTIGNQPIWTPPNAGFQSAPGGFLLGRPIMFSEQCDTLGEKGDLQFIDPMGYYSPTKRGGVRFNSSIHLYFDYDLTAFRWTFRAGGSPYLSAPVQPNKGPNTKSHFVTLEARK